MSKFDVMLIFVFVIITAVVLMTFYQTTHSYDQFSAGFWTFITAVCGGEIVTFSLYRITKEKYERKAEKEKAQTGKHSAVSVPTPENLKTTAALIAATEADDNNETKTVAANTSVNTSVANSGVVDKEWYKNAGQTNKS